MNRRQFLRGASGVFLGLPVLEGLLPRNLRAESARSSFAIFVRQGNGVQQATPEGEPERFWPSFAPGPLTKQRLAADGARALSELAEHAPRLIIARGIRFNDPANACRHSGGGNQVLTAAQVSANECNSTLALGESLDNRIQRELGGGDKEPLTLYAGRKTGYLDEVLSYRGPRELRAAERNPFTVYSKLFGLTTLSAAESAELAASRKSVNDFVRGEMGALLARKDLSSADHQRLDLHFSSIRDLENAMTCSLPADSATHFALTVADLDDDDKIDAVTKLHYDLLTLTMACGAKRAATLQLGGGADSTRYQIDGVKLTSFHDISHRGDLPDAALQHHKIDRKLLAAFKYLLDRLAERQTPSGPLLDQGIVAYVNDLGTGGHSYENIPYLLVGNAGGALKTGQYIDAGGIANNKILNTIGAALGCMNEARGPLDDFGDPALAKGRLGALVTRT